LKKYLSVLLVLSFLMAFTASCEAPSDGLSPILKSYKKNGLTSWWEAVAIYNAGENPAEYKGFMEMFASLEGKTNLKMASYVIVEAIAEACGEAAASRGTYERYKESLKTLLEAPSEQYTLNDYIFAYLALKCSGEDFRAPLMDYLAQAQKPDGGFNLSVPANSGDVDVTAFAIFAMRLLDRESEPLERALKFLEGRVGENGVFGSFGSDNANSTALAASALIGHGNFCERAAEGLALFKLKDGRYSFLEGGSANALATAQAAIALYDLKNNMSVWEKLYLASAK
jgi:hypothetical protein